MKKLIIVSTLLSLTLALVGMEQMKQNDIHYTIACDAADLLSATTKKGASESFAIVLPYIIQVYNAAYSEVITNCIIEGIDTMVEGRPLVNHLDHTTVESIRRFENNTITQIILEKRLWN
jgi:hypothetical protein